MATHRTWKVRGFVFLFKVVVRVRQSSSQGLYCLVVLRQASPSAKYTTAVTTTRTEWGQQTPSLALNAGKLLSQDQLSAFLRLSIQGREVLSELRNVIQATLQFDMEKNGMAL